MDGDLALQLDGWRIGRRRCRLRLCAINVCPRNRSSREQHTSIGGGLVLSPSSLVDDGQLPLEAPGLEIGTCHFSDYREPRGPAVFGRRQYIGVRRLHALVDAAK